MMEAVYLREFDDLSGARRLNGARLRPARQTELRSQFRHCINGYYGEPAFDRTGRRLLYLGFDTLAEGAVTLRDLETGEERVVGRTPFVTFHSSSQRWICEDRGILFRAAGEHGPCPAIVWLDAPDRVCMLDALAGHSVRHVSEDGCRGYGAGPAEHSRRPAIRRIDFESGRAETLVTFEDVLAALPEYLPERDLDWCFSHPVPNRSESLLFVKFQRPQPWTHDSFDFPEWGAFLVIDLRSGAIRSFGKRVSGHPYWMPDDRHILNIKDPLDGSDNRHLVLVDALTGEDRRLLDLPIEGPGHPSVSPRGDLIATDAYSADKQSAPVYVIDPGQERAREIARFPHRMRLENRLKHSKITRANLHPVWSPCGRRILVNCNHNGSHMGLVILDDFIEDGPSLTPARGTREGSASRPATGQADHATRHATST